LYIRCCVPTASPNKMKTPFVVTTTSKIPAWRQPTEKADRIATEVKKIIRELHELQSELYRELAEEDGSRRRQSALSTAPACDDLIELKNAADQLRRFLWFYLEDPSHASDSPQMNAAAVTDEPLVLQDSFTQTGTLAEAASSSFFERLNLVIDGYMQHRGISTRSKAPKS
jgi:hypothetical protein